MSFSIQYSCFLGIKLKRLLGLMLALQTVVCWPGRLSSCSPIFMGPRQVVQVDTLDNHPLNLALIISDLHPLYFSFPYIYNLSLYYTDIPTDDAFSIETRLERI